MNNNPPKSPEPTPSNGVPISHEFQTLLNAGASAASIKSLPSTDPFVPVAIVPSGYKVEMLRVADFEKWSGKPRRKTGVMPFADVDSFIRYFKEHRTDDARIFATSTDSSGTFIGIMNFHGAEPSFNDHKCYVDLQATHEWKIWLSNAKNYKAQGAFATFLEENADMFVSPSGLDLVELVTNLEGKCHVDITQAVKLTTGAIQLKYSEVIEVKGGTVPQSGEMQVPKELTVSIAPFEGCAPRQMRARLRYRIDNRKIQFAYEPIDPHLHVRALIAELTGTIERNTGCEVFKIKEGVTFLKNIEDNDKPF